MPIMNAQKEALKLELEKLVENHGSRSDEAPPFTTEELITIVAVCDDPEWMDEAQIHRRILGTFPYYAGRALDNHVARASGSINQSYRTSPAYDCDAVPGPRLALANHELPLAIMERPVASHSFRPGHKADSMYKVDTRACRVFLRRWLEPERAGIFDFPALPAELHNVVYDIVLVLPVSGLAKYQEQGQARSFVRDKDCSTIHIHAAATTMSCKTTHQYLLPTVAKRLTLLRTCKQTLNVAVPIFYENNKFTFAPPQTTIWGSSELAVSRNRYLSTLRINLEHDQHDFLFKVAPLVNSMEPPLRKLELNLRSDKHWLDMPVAIQRQLGVHREYSFTTYEQIPHFPAIATATARVQELEIIGDCPKANTFFDEEIAEIREKQRQENEAEAARAAARRERAEAKKAKAKEVPTEGGLKARLRKRKSAETQVV